VAARRLARRDRRDARALARHAGCLPLQHEDRPLRASLRGFARIRRAMDPRPQLRPARGREPGPSASAATRRTCAPSGIGTAPGPSGRSSSSSR
jgi:hypothetical protein